MVSPRRSSRARSTAAHTSSTSHSSSSSSSARSRRSEHGSLANHSSDIQRGSPPESGPEHPPDDEDETMADADPDADEDANAVTRCVCGQSEYPGGDDDQSDSENGWFISCDGCSVWQHAMCMGLTMKSSEAPDEYWCEECKPRFHIVEKGVRIYDPTGKHQSKGSRRTTMNSRDADYEVQKALEASKREAASPEDSTRSSNSHSRGKKRSTSETSDEPKSQDSKRARMSNSPEDAPDTAASAEADPTTETPVVSSKSHKSSAGQASAKKSSKNGSKNGHDTHPSKSSSKRNSTRNKTSEKNDSKREKEKEKDHHSQDSDHSTNEDNTSRGAKAAPARKHKSPVASPPRLPPPAPVEPAEPVPAPVKRSARNAPTTATGAATRRNPRKTRQSEDPPAMSREPSSAGGHNRDRVVGLLEKPTKPRVPQDRMSMNEMKKRVSGISEFVTRTQVEMANMGESDVYAYLAYLAESAGLKEGTATPTGSGGLTPIGATGLPAIQVNGNAAGNVLDMATEALTKGVGQMGVNPTAVGIMEQLSTKINRWQQTYSNAL